jgi:D-alanyl-D-alanine carboxypeptidase (penicillin-binding protein 5/6)
MLRCRPLFRLAASLVLAFTAALPARAFETQASVAYVYDLTSGTVLMDKKGDVPVPPASMSKLMTINLLFEALKDGRVTMDTRFSVSEKAQAMGGSTMFLNTSDRPTVEQLIQGIIINSGNDACVVVAEGLAGSEDAFAQMMTDRAKALGMEHSTFGNASGWPNPRQRMSMHDLVTLAVRLITKFPEYYHFFGQTEFPFDNRAPDNRFNRDPLLKLGIGADGLKTGHTEEAGYGLVGSAMQGNRRIVFAMAGLPTEAARAKEGEAIVNWAFRQFVMRTPVKAGKQVAEVPVFLGATANVGLVPADDLTLLMPVTAAREMTGEVNWTAPIEAPVAAGQELATLTVHREGLGDVSVPLVAAQAVDKAGFLPRFNAAAMKALALAQKFASRSGSDGGDAAPAAPAATAAN